jgi:hypothetical protein
MSVRALNFLENWLDDHTANEPFSTNYEARSEELAATLAADAQAEGIAVEEFGEEVENLAQFIREALEARAEFTDVVDPKRGP